MRASHPWKPPGTLVDPFYKAASREPTANLNLNHPLVNFDMQAETDSQREQSEREEIHTRSSHPQRTPSHSVTPSPNPAPDDTTAAITSPMHFGIPSPAVNQSFTFRWRTHSFPQPASNETSVASRPTSRVCSTAGALNRGGRGGAPVHGAIHQRGQGDGSVRADEQRSRPHGRPRLSPEPISSEQMKRGPGRPRKDRSDQRVNIRVTNERFRVPGTSGTSTPTSTHPFFFPRSSAAAAASASASVPITSNPQNTAPDPSSGESTEPRRSFVIPSDDFLREIEVDDDDDDGGEAGEGTGLGAEDGGEDEDDEPGPRRPMATWLIEAYKERLAEAKKRNSDGVPLLYARHKTFWFPQKSTYFLLRDGAPSPTKLFNPKFFLWDPIGLCKIPCPEPDCQRSLIRHDDLSGPRRVVDMNSTFYMIGFRYKCPKCTNPVSGKDTVTYRSWDDRILGVLPGSLGDEFPARLTHRSAVSVRVASWMRSSIMCGMGVKQFSDTLRVQHRLSYDKLHNQYLKFLISRIKLAGSQFTLPGKYPAFLPFDDCSPDGFHGFVPCAPWLRDLYYSIVHEREGDFDQAVAMLSALICAIDHSFKVTKHIMMVNGERVFVALLTVTNEYGEIRVCSLVATKAHSQFVFALEKMAESLRLYGHDQPLLFYTDNMGDKSFLEAVFPSLRQGVSPIEKHGHLEVFVLPSDIEIEVQSDEVAINRVLSEIIQDLPVEALDPDVVVGLDCEWNVALTGQGRAERGEVALVQLAYGKKVYMLQISQFVHRRKLPKELVHILQNPRVLKVGCMVTADLRQLEAVSGSSRPFCGAVDLGNYAKERMVVAKANCSLQDLCASTLGKCLKKNVAERISAAWEGPHLTREQQYYAACDAYISLAIYRSLSAFSVPHTLSHDPAPATPVLLYHTDHTNIIAIGELLVSSQYDARSYDGVILTSQIALVDILEVLVPGAIISSHRGLALESFGPPPFTLACNRNLLRQFDESVFALRQRNQLLASESNHPTSEPLSAPLEVVQGLEGSLDMSASESVEVGDGDGVGSLLRGALHGEDRLDDDSGAGVPNSTLATSQLPVDSTSQDQGVAEIGSLTHDEAASHRDGPIRSRVLKDVFHVFNMLRLSTNHALRKDFGRALRDTLFVPDIEDRLRITAWAAAQPHQMTFDQLVAARPKWVWKRCRRLIPAPEILFPLVQSLFLAFGPLKDAKTHAPLFNASHWKISRQILDLVRQGFISDPPGIPLYSAIGFDKKAGCLPIYRCVRGTNFTEGGVHTHLRSHMPTSGASIRHANAALKDFVLQHNLRVGTLNRTGKHYQGHYDIWITNEIQENIIFLRNVLDNPVELHGWVNGNLYVPTTERLGVLPVPDDIRQSSGMHPYSPPTFPSTDRKQRIKPPSGLQYLAKVQGTMKPILPVHTPAEVALFRRFMAEHDDFRRGKTPVWSRAVYAWNQEAHNCDNIYYKLPEQLKTYFVKWEANLNTCQTLSACSSTRIEITSKARDEARSLATASDGTMTAVPNLSQLRDQNTFPASLLGTRPREHLALRQGLRDPGPGSITLDEPLTAESSGHATVAGTDEAPTLSSSPLPMPVPEFIQGSSAGALALFDDAAQSVRNTGRIIIPPTTDDVWSQLRPATSHHQPSTRAQTPTLTPNNSLLATDPNASFRQTIERLVDHRVTAQVASTEVRPPPPQPREPRTCAKCGNQSTCSGRQTRWNCTQPCQDCGEYTCVGRNMKRSERPCSEAWDGFPADKIPQGSFKFLEEGGSNQPSGGGGVQ